MMKKTPRMFERRRIKAKQKKDFFSRKKRMAGTKINLEYN